MRLVMRKTSTLWVVLVASCVIGKKDSKDLSGQVRGSTLVDIPLTNEPTARNQYALRLGPSRYRVGDPQPSEVEEFGYIDGAYLLGNGVVVVRDLKKKRVTMVDSAGNVRVLARTGEGPGEVIEPSGAFVVDSNEIAVVDNGQRRVVRYVVDGGSATIDTSYRTTGAPIDVCGLRSGGYAGFEFDPQTESTVQIADSVGQRIRSIGSPFLKASLRLNRYTAIGKVVCIPGENEIVLATILGDVVAYATTGRVLWRRVVPDFDPPLFKEVGRSVVLGAVPDSAKRGLWLRSFTQVGDGLAVLQYEVSERMSLGGGKVKVDQTGIESRLIDLKSGAEVGRQSDLPFVMSTFGKRAAVAGVDPQPWLELRGFELVRNPE